MTDAKICIQCRSSVHPEAKRCAYCTSWIDRPMTSYWSFWVALIVVAVVATFLLAGLAVPVELVEL